MTDQATENQQPAPPMGVSSSEGLGLAPERAGQPRMMTIIDGAQEDETGHWYSPAAVREMLAAERERCAKHCDTTAAMLREHGYPQAAASVATLADDFRA